MATKKSRKSSASKTGSKKSSKKGRKGSKGGGPIVPGEPIIVGGGGGRPEDEPGIFIEFPTVFHGSMIGLEHVFHGTDLKITRVQITGDLPNYDEKSPSGQCRIQISFDDQ